MGVDGCSVWHGANSLNSASHLSSAYELFLIIVIQMVPESGGVWLICLGYTYNFVMLIFYFNFFLVSAVCQALPDFPDYS